MLFYAGDFKSHFGWRLLKIKSTSEINFSSGRTPKIKYGCSFLQDIRCLLSIMRIFGLLPAVFVTPASAPAPSIKDPVKISRKIYAYSALLFFPVAVNNIKIFNDLLSVIRTNRAFNLMIYLMANLLYPCMCFSLPIVHWCFSHKLVCYINAWTEFLNHYEKLFQNCPDLKIKRCVYRGLITGFFLATFLASLLSFGPVMTLNMKLMYCEFFLLHITTTVLWCVFCNVITVISKDMGNTLTKLPRSLRPQVLEEFTQLWLELSSMTQHLSAIICPFLGLGLVTVTISALISSFGIITRQVQGSPPSLMTFGSVFYALSDVFSIFIICDVANEATKQVGEQVKFKLLNRNYSHSENLEVVQVDKFLQAVKVNYPHIYLAGFLALNRPLFWKFISILVTYLIVIVQFQMSTLNRTS